MAVDRGDWKNVNESGELRASFGCLGGRSQGLDEAYRLQEYEAVKSETI